MVNTIKIKWFWYILLAVFLLFQIYFWMRSYLFTSCFIPTDSMTPTLLEGDYIYTSLQIPGRRIFEKNSTDTSRMSIRRMNGIRKIKKGDVVVFNYPYSERKDKMILSQKQFFCKRCIAIPGDTVYYRCYDPDLMGGEALYIPKKGDKIQMDSVTYKRYHKCVEYETGVTVRWYDGIVYLGDKQLEEYCFQQDYYFMLGDKTIDSYDSRFWGLLPDDFILGVGCFIWYSRDKISGEIRWNRFFSKI